MTTYRAIAATEDQVEAFVTAELAQAWTDNVLAIAEADATAPAALLPTVLLGTGTPSGVSSSTLSSLVLTPFKLLLVSYSFTTNLASGTGVLALGGGNLATSIPSIASTAAGIAIIDLASGRTGNMYGGGGAAVGSSASGYSTATTSVAFTYSGAGPSITGTWRLYGLK